MKIAFDAKRAYQNNTGLGYYSRTLITSLANAYPENEYFLCAPKLTNRYSIAGFRNMHNIVPETMAAKKLKSLWRSKWVTEDLVASNINIYHGLSNEIPVCIRSSGIQTVVTIHDLIFERYPELYNWVDVHIYRNKFRYACKNADHIIAISEQTKKDIINFYNIPEESISVCYQSCNPAYGVLLPREEKERIRKLYSLPENFLLSVGSIIERKNLLNVCKALSLIKKQEQIPLVVIGEGGPYKQQVKAYLAAQQLTEQVIFLSENTAAKSSSEFQSGEHFPAIYQLSSGLLYPSVFEGFGIPVLEALMSRVPVITSSLSCLPETGGDAAYYVNPYSPDEIANAITTILNDKTLVTEMVRKGLEHADRFTPEKCAAEVMQVYLRL
ncbi:glycosyltransferase family 1 protein [Segetibacter sp. 3557_3]|uniref:glycosyltransferase family 4 protein n=1 Tax=Segetibacter sp. 3557_3 TaxID=2547429 RepID=UPI001058AA33|nr:glycosyltransferase family 1 protein [Segetibacter sp. 3557_3]TDH28750.1 glycosyltransferase family 1 protein [Segetibacter sp. 3557_3]